MVMDTLEQKRLVYQRRTRRLRQQRLLHNNDHWANGNGAEHTAGATNKPKKELLISDLGWTKEQARDTHYRLRNFALVWDGPGLEEYDEM